MRFARLIPSVSAAVVCALLLASGNISAGDGNGLERSPIGRIAATLKPGSFVKLETELPPGTTTLSDLFRVKVDDHRRLSIDGWTDSAHWDPKRKRTFFIGMRKYKKFISYDALTNRWQELGWAGEPPPKLEKFGHVYGRTALDWKRGHYYWLAPDKVLNRYRIDDSRWDAIRGVAMSGYISMEWHEKLDMLIAINPGHEVVAFRDGETKVLGKSAVHGYHSVGRYNRTRGEMLFAGGNQSRRKVSSIAHDGKIRDHRDAPFDISIGNASLTYDPLTGNYLVMLGKQRQLYEYDPDREEWRLAGEWNEAVWPFGPYGFYTPVVIDELGVIFWQSEAGNHVYRHKSAFDQASKSR